jgi:ATP phosphoribosyltransferase regulatory subunit
LEETALPAHELAEIKKHIQQRDYVAAKAAVQDKAIREPLKEILAGLPLSIGDAAMLDKCLGAVASQTARRAIGKLMEIHETLRLMRLDQHVLFDLGLTGHLDYYTGVIFRGYAPGAGFSVLEGGRCDKLAATFGKAIPSAGFAIRIDDLYSALLAQNTAFGHTFADTLIAYAPQAKETALLCADNLRENGLFAENSLVGCDIEANIAYAKAKALRGMLYFEGDGRILLFDLAADKRFEVSIDDILGNKEEST